MSIQKTLFFFVTGTPGSRFFCPLIKPDIAQKLRLIVVERPGFGLSTPKEGRSILDWSDDLKEVAGILGIDTFGLIGYSAGGPFSLGCLYKIPEKIWGSVIVSSLSPRTTPGVTNGMPMFFRFGYWCAENWPWMLKLALSTGADAYRKNARKQVITDFSNFGDADKAMLKNEDIIRAFAISSSEIYSRRQDETDFLETQLFAIDWQFKISDIKASNVLIYGGEDDKGCNKTMTKFLHENIKGSELRLVKDKGHLLFFDIWNDALQYLCELKEEKKESKEEETK